MSIDTITDNSWDEGRAWDGEFWTATRVEDTFWTAEIEIPAHQFEPDRIQSEQIWDFNVARVRITNASEFGQWVPTYGDAHRPDRFGFLIFD